MISLFLICLLCALIPFVMYFRNIREFRQPPRSVERFPVSVLIPARNEEHGIAECVNSVLASTLVDLEVIVLDDGSTDRTAEIVRLISDPRLRLETAPPLPEGWAGKQHACFVLSKLATKPIVSFLDADVRLAPDALARMAAFQKASGAALVSGFPRQRTVTLMEKMLIPLVHFILLGFLPLNRMRASADPRFGAGCGQWFLTTRDAYDQAGGHAAIRSSFHDGIRLPRAYRSYGFKTDICDVTHLATCRMYQSAGQVWNGLAKNAREGLGSPRGICFWTVVLLCGQVVPFVVFFYSIIEAAFDSIPIVNSALMSLSLLGLMMRADACLRFRQSGLSLFLHPIGILALLLIQWYAMFRHGLGRPVGWKGRSLPGVKP